MSEKKLYNDDDVLKCANMAIALIKKTEEQEAELTRLKELNRKAIKLLNDFCGTVELSPPAQDRLDEILTVLEGKGE